MVSPATNNSTRSTALSSSANTLIVIVPQTSALLAGDSIATEGFWVSESSYSFLSSQEKMNKRGNMTQRRFIQEIT